MDVVVAVVVVLIDAVGVVVADAIIVGDLIADAFSSCAHNEQLILLDGIPSTQRKTSRHLREGAKKPFHECQIQCTYKWLNRQRYAVFGFVHLVLQQ